VPELFTIYRQNRCVKIGVPFLGTLGTNGLNNTAERVVFECSWYQSTWHTA